MAAHLLGQAGLHRAEAVLHLGLGDIDVSARFEGQSNAGLPRRGAGRGHIEKAIDPIELLLDYLSNILLERLCPGAWINDIDRQ